MKLFFEKYQFWLKCWGICFGILSLVFSFYMFHFILGDHDWRYLRYGMPLWGDVWEARVTQYMPPYFFLKGQVLPILGCFLGLMFFSGGCICLAKWYEVPEKYGYVLIFTLLVTLNPLICTHLYYNYLYLSFGLWHFLGIIGVICAWYCAEKLSLKFFLISAFCLWTVLLGYVPVLEQILIIATGKFLIDLMQKPRLTKAFLLKYTRFVSVLLLILLLYGGALALLMKYQVIFGWYNTEMLGIADILHKLAENWQLPFKITYNLPYALIVFCVCAIGVLSGYPLTLSKVLYAICGIILLFYVAFVAAFISPFDVFSMFRVHAYSVPYISGIILVWVLNSKKLLLRNIAFVLCSLLILLYVRQDLITQKIWYLGNQQDLATVERIKKDLLPELQADKHYRLSTIGNLFGRKKFAGVNFTSDKVRDDYREYWGGGIFLNTFFSAGFFAYEKNNPIYGDIGYLAHIIFSGVFNNDFSADELDYAREFANHFGDDKQNLLQGVQKLKPYPEREYFFVGEKDIFLMLYNNYYSKEVIKWHIEHD